MDDPALLTTLTTAASFADEAGAAGGEGDGDFGESRATMMATSGRQRKLTVIKKPTRESSPTKKRLLVTKRITDPEDVDDDFERLPKGNDSPQKLTKRRDGSILPWSVLGETNLYESADGSTKSLAQMVNVKVRSSRTNRMWRGSGQSSRSSRKRADTEEGEIDPNQDLLTHLEGLGKLIREAEKKREQEAEDEKKLLTQLPISDRINYIKEAKMLSKWQERLQEWERIEQKIVKRVGGHANTLLMNSIDEYRAKNEDYEIMQAAIPAQERFGPDSWMMTLRGGGERFVSIGNIFSGLMCEVSLTTRVPPMLRKPKVKFSEEEVHRIDSNPSLTMRKNALKKRIETIRPYEIGEDAAQGLLFVSRDLMQWAFESTNNLLQSRLQSQGDQDRGRFDREADNARYGYDRPPYPSAMKMISSTNIVFSCLQGQTCYENFQFANTGSTAIRYSFARNPRMFDGSKQLVENTRRSRGFKTREYDLSKRRFLFHCLHAEGSVMPGETVAVTFVFCNRGSAGNFSEEWIMSLSPQTTVEYTSGTSDHTDARASSMPEVGAVPLLLRGQSLTVDQSAYRRNAISKFILKSSEQRFITDEITHCVRRVRGPICKEQLDLRKIDYFSSINREELNKLSQIFGENVSLFFNSDRLYGFRSKFDEFLGFLDRVLAEYDNQHAKYVELTHKQDAFLLNDSDVDFGDTSQEEIQMIRSAIFPEATIDIFDEITEDDISPAWDFNLSKPFRVISSSKKIIDVVMNLEKAIQEVIKANEKEAARQARRAAAGSDDEYESEEEEEEEEEDDAAPKPIHPLIQAKVDLESSMYAMLYQLVIEPNGLPESHARDSLIVALNAFEDIELSARQTVGIAEGVSVPPPPNPFTSDEGAQAWKAILTEEVAPVAEDPKKGGAAKKPAGKEKDKGKDAAPAAPDASQSNTFYRELHNKVASSIIDSLIDNMFCQVEKDYAQASCQSVASSVAVLRETDFVEGGLVVISVRGDSFFHDKSPSAFDVRKPQHAGVAKMITIASERGAKGVLITFESPGSDAPPPLKDVSFLQKALEQASLEVAQQKEKKRPKPKKNAPPLPKISPQKYDCVIAKTFADVELILSKMGGVKDKRGFPVAILEDLRSTKIVPRDLELPEEVSDDDACPLPIGLEEHQKKRAEDWKKAGPKLVPMGASNGTVVNCYAGAAEALDATIRNQAGQKDVLWIDYDTATLFKRPSISALQRCSDKLRSSAAVRRVLAGNARDVASWSELLVRSRDIPRCIVVSTADNADEDNEGARGNEAEDANDTFKSFVRSLFSGSVPSHVNSVAVIGGKIRPDKFMTIDKLLDSVSAIIIAGEVCLPFLQLTKKVIFRKYDSLCKSYASAARELLKKARLRGVRIVLPVDLADGDEAVGVDLLMQCYKNVAPGGRDEGADYQGEFKLHPMVDFDSASGNAADNTRTQVNNYILDVGPGSCSLFSEVLSTADIVFSWGTVGCAELSSYQAGQRAVVTASIKPAFSEDDDAAVIEKYDAKMPRYTFVVGESNVEWWSRIADSEGEINGELARNGVVACTSRDSSIVCGLLTHATSASMSMLLRRDPSPSEWRYNTRPVPPVEEAEADSDEE